MSRPLSGPRVRPSSSKAPGSNQKGISYEDMLVAQYLEELRRAPPKNGIPPSGAPYINSHIVPTSRPMSATASLSRPRSGHKPKIDPKFIADPSMWDPATPRNTARPPRGRRRPISAPAFQRRPLSATYGGGSRPTSAKSSTFGRRIKPLYKKQASIIVATAFKNGTRDIFTRLAAPSMKIMLEMCTDRLELHNAARRVFLEDGTEVFSAGEISRDADIYISAGENFKDPYQDVKRHTTQQKTIAWTMNGLIWAPESKRRSTKTVLSKRFRSLIENSKRRVLVFKNGRGTEGSEIVADPERFEDFLQHCTAKLDLGSYARVLYDWEGNEIQDLKDAPVLDQCLQTWSTPVMGPLWVSKGECFNPLGVMEFLEGLITYTRAKLKEAKHYQKQLKYASDDHQRHEVEIVAILSMNEAEIDETLEIVGKDIEDFSNALNRLKEQVSKLRESGVTEGQHDVEFTMNHIKELKESHRLVGQKGLRLKVYENGTYGIPTTIYFNLAQAARGINTDKQLMARLLDECSTKSALSTPKMNPNIKPTAEKLYDDQGHEIKVVRNLEYDQEVWLSFGEAWRNPFSYVMTMTYDKVRVYNASQGGEALIREQLFSEDIPTGKYKASDYEVTEGLPDDYSNVENIMHISEIEAMVQIAGVAKEAHFIRSKAKQGLLLFPDIVVDEHKKNLWPMDAQCFKFTQDGLIRSKCQPNVVLTVLEHNIIGNLNDPLLGVRETRVEEGYLVGMRKKGNLSSQEWVFTADGLIYCRSHPDLYLTYVGGKFGKESTMVQNESTTTPKSSSCYVAVCPKIENKDAKAQRWAIKQMAMDETGRFLYTQTENRDWNKNAYSWPVTENGELDSNFTWPLEGKMIPYAPALRKSSTSKGGTAVPPLRLMAIKNGIRDITKAMAVVGPDLTNMRKDAHKHNKKYKNMQKMKNGDTESMDVALHCDDELSVLKLEFILFLERCTSMLDLPFAARRLFDEAGQEHFSLRNLKRDQLIYVSCGEAWAEPKLSKGEQQRRYLLNNLASDVKQMQQFISLRKAQNLVLEVEGTLGQGSRLIVSESALTAGNEDEEGAPSFEEQPDTVPTSQTNSWKDEFMSSHDRAHRISEDWLNSRKWPWERKSNEAPLEKGKEDQFSNKDLYHKFRPRPRRPANQALQLQKFVFSDGYIACSYNQNLVLGVEESEGRLAEVVLTKRRPDDVFQRWILQDNGIIQSKNNANLVLTVSLPSIKAREEFGDAADMSHIGSQVLLKNRKEAQMGRANQRWFYDDGTGFIMAFHTSEMDKELTAAIKANVCTFAVFGETIIDQPGYSLDMPMGRGEKAKRIVVCSSCAHAMRGRFKLDCIKSQVDFACAMGKAKDLGIKQLGSFKCLNGKVDLSTHEAQHTLDEWMSHLNMLRDELSVRTIAKEISASRRPYTVKVLAYRNGQGRSKAGEVIVGSSVPGLLDQCTTRLGLTQAARRLYTADGTVVMDMEDLVTSAQNQFVQEAREDLRAAARAKKEAGQGNANDSLMARVDLEEDETEADETEDEVEPTYEPDGDDVHFGCDAAVNRQYRDRGNRIIIPNPDQPVTHTGLVTAWRLYANDRGKIQLLVLRPGADSSLSCTVVSTLEFTAPAEGYFVVDCRRKTATRVSEDGMALGGDLPIKIDDMNIEVGDVIGYCCPTGGLIPFDYEEFESPPAFYRLQGEEVVKGLKSTYEPLETKARNYSLNITVTPMKLVPPKPGDKKKKTKPQSPEKTEEASQQNGETKKKKKLKGRHIDPPPAEMVLRYPIEVWVSLGETFVKPDNVKREHKRALQNRNELAAVSYELDKEKHVLRQMQGRRLDELNPGTYQSTMNPASPVLIEGHWQDPTIDEQVRHNNVHQLQTHLSEVKASQKGNKGRTADLSKPLYTQPSTKRVLVFPNGESITRAVYVWGETQAQLLDNSAQRLGMRRTAKFLYDMNGEMVSDIASLERDQLLCISPTKGFLRPKESNQQVEVKANWGRARRKYGPDATDIMVAAKKNPHVDVDAFGPSEIAGN